jgi:Flp pilus assembly protein TadG
LNTVPPRVQVAEPDSTCPRPEGDANHDAGRRRLADVLRRMLGMSGRHHRRRERGAALVELAFVFSLLAMLLVGVTTSAIAFNQNNSIENAAREASRYAATLPGPVDIAWLQEVRDVARSAALGELEPSVPGQYICVAQYDGTSWIRLTDTNGVETLPDSQSCFTDSLPADQPRVQIVTSRDTTINAAVFSIDVTLKGEAAARYER